MAFFSKKQCDICGGNIGLLGNKKLDDGNMCKDCGKKLSPWFSDRRKTTVAEINDQLVYRKENEKRVEEFKASQRLGIDTMVLIDEKSKKFIVSFDGEIKDNPDVIDFADVISCTMDIDETKTELKQLDKDGKEVSYMIRRYEYYYNFYITIAVNNPYFETINFKLNTFRVDGQSRHDYDRYREIAENICKVLGEQENTAENIVENTVDEESPKTPSFCPNCGGAVIHEGAAFCQSCGGSLRV